MCTGDSHQISFLLLKCCFSCSSSSQCHKHHYTIVPMSLYVETEITQQGLVSKKKTTWSETRDCQIKETVRTTEIGWGRGGETEKRRLVLWKPVNPNLWWYYDYGEDRDVELPYCSGILQAILSLDNQTSECVTSGESMLCWRMLTGGKKNSSISNAPYYFDTGFHQSLYQPRWVYKVCLIDSK